MPSSSPQTILWSLLAGLSLVFGPCAAVAQQADSPIIRYSDLAHPQFGDAGMVASQNYLSSQVGAEILAAGGNAVDAAVAVGFSLAVFVARSAWPHTAELGWLPGPGVFRNVRRYPQAQTWPDLYLTRPDMPALSLDALDGDWSGACGPAGDRATVEGPSPALLAWLIGRSSGEGLHVRPGPLPDLPPWF